MKHEQQGERTSVFTTPWFRIFAEQPAVRMVVVLNNTGERRSVAFPSPDDGNKSGYLRPGRVVTFIGGIRQKDRSIVPGRTEISAADWEAVKTHVSGRNLCKSKDGRALPVLMLDPSGT